MTEWDGRPDEIQAEDPIRVFEETMDLTQGSHGWALCSTGLQLMRYSAWKIFFNDGEPRSKSDGWGGLVNTIVGFLNRR